MLQRQTEPPTSQAPNHSTDLSVARQSARLSAQVKSSVEGMSQIPIKTGVDRQEEDVTLPCTAVGHMTSSSLSSSDEVILFRGRNRKVERGVFTSKEKNQSTRKTKPEEELKPGCADILGHGSNQRIRRQSNSHYVRGRRARKNRIQGYERRCEGDEDILSDYIANMRDHGFASDAASHETSDLRGPAITSRFESTGGNRSLDTPQHLISSTLSQQEPNLMDAELFRADVVRPLAEKDSDEESLVHLIATQCLDTSFGNDQEQRPVIQGPVLDRNRPGTSQPPQHRKKPSSKAFQNNGQTKYRGYSFPSLPEGFDIHLEENLRASWSKDRLKKTQRKKQREDMRLMGLLGRHTKRNDLRAKYPHGMDLVEITEEVKTFLQKKQETITFPPLALRCRKFIHELANQFGVKSKSVGGTDQRCPSLSRTAKTLPYAESRFEQALAHLRRDYCSYIQKTQVGQWRKPELNNRASTSYQEGEIVGAAAPALAAENRGRVMLEKMGWSNGTALGAADNKGILQPVTHTMRRNKIGLQ